MQKEDLSTDTTFDPCWFSLDYTFNYAIFPKSPWYSQGQFLLI